MLRLLDGPAEGFYQVARAPLYLRAVVSVTGKADVLDQLTDTPQDSEKVYVYKRQGEAGVVSIRFTRPTRCSIYATGEYRHLSEVDGEQLRDTAAWREWVMNTVGQPVDASTGEIVDVGR